ncbi:major facilitator superfamily domain-containing protein [Xylaria bambusicola]|uniref:major facilitator superfamily domain-containing protein n=1 Tax=Xylaria bambusicola TaxID=326684 RepID=UPI0020075F77|nr:major facilitator superfamily domain-containing protein [Xylaria bambusicola]KAI0503244.1 major facilitator superfamily domain-containing protein [Xylaria bambusicola]
MESIPQPVQSTKPNLTLADVDIQPYEPEKGLLDSSPISSSDEVIVDWEGPDDPANPLNWSSTRKTFIITLVSAVTFNISLVPTIFAPGVPLLLREFHSDSTALASFLVSAYVIPFAISPLVVAPLSELYGRNVVMNTANFAFLVFTIVCAISNSIPLFLVFRVLQGGAACVPLVLGGGMIGDLVVAEKRGRALSGWQLGPLLGPVIGPVAGGYIAQNVGWRWLFWLVAILSGVLTVLYLLIPETYHSTLLARKAARLQKADGSRTYIAAGSTRSTPRELLRKSIVRPLKMLCKSPIVLILSLQLAVGYGYLYLLFTTFIFVFEGQYHFNAGAAGLSYLGLGVGFLIGLLANGFSSDYLAKREAKGGEIKPESRLAPLLIGSLLIPAGLIWYGWTAEFRIHWIVPIIGTSLIGIGVNLIWVPIQSYLIDAFTIYAASAIAANTVVRSVFGVVLPLAGQPLYDKLGLGWGNTLLAFIALATAPLTWLIMKYGERIRLDPRFQLDL